MATCYLSFTIGAYRAPFIRLSDNVLLRLEELNIVKLNDKEEEYVFPILVCRQLPSQEKKILFRVLTRA